MGTPTTTSTDPIIISWSEIDAYRQCPFKHHNLYRERWQEPTPGPALVRGTAWHQVMEHHYQALMALPHRGRKPGTALMKSRQPEVRQHIDAINQLLGRDSKTLQPTEQQTLLDWMYTGYLETYGTDPEWEIVAVEWKGVVPLPNPEGGPSRFLLKAKIDLLAKMRNRLWLWDHKTGANLPRDKDLDFDDQFGLYTWMMREVGFPVIGSMHSASITRRNKVQAQTLESRFLRTYMDRNDYELDQIAAEAYRTAEKMWPEGGIDRVPERTPDTERCQWRCCLTEACLHARRSRKPTAMREMLVAHGFQQSIFRPAEIEYAQRST